jgi:nicotinic acid phosphoribosyltransferase
MTSQTASSQLSGIFPVANPIYDGTDAEKHLCTTLLHDDPDHTKVMEGRTINDIYLRCKAHVWGLVLLIAWLFKRASDIMKILSEFNDNFVPKAPLNATAFNDLYKWTMMPVIRRLEKIKGPITVTFSIDFRDKGLGSMRNELKNADGELIKLVHAALLTLEDRQFDRTVFEEVISGPRADLFSSCPETIDMICGPVGRPRTLVDKGGVKPYNQRYVRTPEDADKVTLSFYYDETKEYEPGESPGVHFIKATGPWHKVTWLETAMMQCVYETKLRYDLAKKSISYSYWLYGGLLRCAKSVAYTRFIQTEAIKAGRSINPALFTGRRTGGYSFLVLQNMFFADHFIQNGPPAAGGPAIVPNSLLTTTPDSNSTIALGTSSVDSWVKLRSMNLPCLMPAGTHAHELSMVGSVLFPHLDKNKFNVPISQIIVHYMYYELVWKVIKDPFKGPMAMLPDTTGTRTFMKAANLITVRVGDSNVPVLKIFQTARQDSGSLADFKTNMINFNYLQHNGKPHMVGGMPTTMMASEIDSTAKFLEAFTLGYSSIGAGGFYGDTERVWGQDVPSNSMAVKAVKVEYVSELDYHDMPEINVSQAPVIAGFPVKTGDPDSLRNTTLPSKLSLDKDLSAGELVAIKDQVIKMREAAITSMIVDSKGNMGSNIPIESFFDISTGVMPEGLAPLF